MRARGKTCGRVRFLTEEGVDRKVGLFGWLCAPIFTLPAQAGWEARVDVIFDKDQGLSRNNPSHALFDARSIVKDSRRFLMGFPDILI